MLLFKVTPSHIIMVFGFVFRLKLGLKAQQKERNMKQKGLVGEVSTRWGSKYEMVRRVYDNREALQPLLLSGKLAGSLLVVRTYFC